MFSRRLPFVRCESGRRVGVAESGKMRKWENERMSAAHGEGFSELRSQMGAKVQELGFEPRLGVCEDEVST